MDFIQALPFVDLLVVLEAQEKGDDNNIKTPIGELIKQINIAFNRTSCDCVHDIYYYFKLKDTAKCKICCFYHCKVATDIKTAFGCKCCVAWYCSKNAPWRLGVIIVKTFGKRSF
jgi:hypothetical protein